MYSLLDGFSTPREYLDKAKELGLNGFAISEHGNQYSWVYFDKIKKDYPEIKMIFGVELYECFDMEEKNPESRYFHLIALAKNENGRKALNEIITKSNFEGFYYKPRISIDKMKPYANDLIVLSACLGSKIARESDFNKSIEYINEYKSIFPYFFLEMQSHKHVDQENYNKKILKLSQITNTPYVITTDSHVASKKDLYYQARHVQIAHDDETLTESYEGCYLQSENEIYEIMTPQIGKENVKVGLENTNIINDMIDVVNMPFQDPKLPHYPLPNGFDSDYDYLVYLLKRGWEDRGINKLSKEEIEVRKKRLDYELEVINQMKYDGYFLIVCDFVEYAKQQGIAVSAGRGCFLPNTKVLMSNGQTCNIQDVEVGQKVVTHKGNIQTVQSVMEYDANEEIFVIKGAGVEETKLTKDHEVYAIINEKCTAPGQRRVYCTHKCSLKNKCSHAKLHQPSWVKASELKRGDYLFYPKPKLIKKAPPVVDLLDFGKKLKSDIGHDSEYVWIKNGENGIRNGSKMKRYIDFSDNNVAWFSGAFIGNGWTRINKKSRKYEIGLAFHSDQNDKILRATKITKEMTGKNPNVKKHNNRKVVQVIFSGKLITCLFAELFGQYSINKKIPDFYMNDVDMNTHKALLNGLFDTDGHFSTKENRVKYSSVSKNLVSQIKLIMVHLGYYGSITIRNHKNKNWNSEYSLTYSGEQLEHMKKTLFDKITLCDTKYGKNDFYETEQGFFFKVMSTDFEKYNGKVYDLSVPGDTSYVVSDTAVHNSGAGSFVCYLLGITNIDPIKYDLIFERFLNPERISMPDLDIDFGDRDLVVNYLEKKYGIDKVAQIINFSYITPKVAVKDVGRILKIPYKICEEISSYFVTETFEETMNTNVSKLKRFKNEYPDLFDVASRISGKVRQVSINACGLGIVDTKITDYMGMMVGSKGESVIQVDKKMVEEIGIVKFDILGVETLNKVQQILKEINKDISTIDINDEKFEFDKKSYKLLGNALTDGVFQLESAGMKSLLSQIKPKNLLELSDVLALYRPDTMGLLDEYVKNKNNPKNITYLHEDMRPILEKTYGCMIYQEQVMEVVRKFGGLTYGEADTFRKGIGKKDRQLVQEEAIKLHQRIIDNGYSEEISKLISEDMKEKGGYSFNKSHSIAYAVLSLQTAYLKAHYPVEFMMALLNSNIGNYSNIGKYIAECKNMNIKVLPPNINKSKRNFSIYNDSILFGLGFIKGIGENTTDKILEERSLSNFKSFQDFISRCSPDKSTVVSLIKSGAISGLSNKKRYLLKYADSLFVKKEYKPVKTLPTLKTLKDKYGIVEDNKEIRLEKYNRARKIEFDEVQKQRYKNHMNEFIKKYGSDEELWEFETLSMFLTNNPFKEYYKSVVPFHEVENGSRAVVICMVINIKNKKDRNNNKFCYLDLYNSFEIIESICWSSKYVKYHDYIKKGNSLAILGRKNEDKLFVEAIKSIEEWKKDVNIN